MFTTVPELERNAYWRFYKTKRGIASTLPKQIFEKCFLCCIKQGRPCHWSDPTDHPSEQSSRLQMFFKKSFVKISPILQKNICVRVSFHCEISDTFKNTPFLWNTSGGCFWSVFCSNPKASRTYSSVSTVFYFSQLFVFYLKKPLHEL